MDVSEIFCSIQGEGRYAGTPAYFVRLQGCPIHCFFCDTKDTWFTDRADAPPFLRLSPREILNSIIDMTGGATTIPLVVITGGEPFYGQNGEELADLVDTIAELKFRVSIETSGIYFPDSGFNPATPVHITISPKYRAGAEKFLPIRQELFNVPDMVDIKLLMDGQPISDTRITNFLQEHAPLGRRLPPGGKIFLQPIDFGSETEFGRHQSCSAKEQVVEKAKSTGWNVSCQMHKALGIR